VSANRAALRTERLVRARRALSEPEKFGFDSEEARLYAIEQLDAVLDDTMGEIRVVLDVIARGTLVEVEELLSALQPNA
jgi:hypothetical protein